MKQADINAAWQQTSGAITYLQQPVIPIPGLRKPYAFEAPIATVKQLQNEIKQLFKTFPEDHLQIALLDTKAVTYGICPSFVW
jgi:hypothetical protein